MKICITCPYLDNKRGGGVTNYYNVLKKYLDVYAYYFQNGTKKKDENKLQKVSHLVRDVQRFRSHLKQSSSNYDLIHLNPSLDYKALIREGFFHLLSKRYGHRTLVFIHGWDLPVQENITRYFLPFFRIVFGHADAFVVLAEEFRETLVSWGIRNPIYVDTTPVDDELIKGFELERRLESWGSGRKIQILFLGRIIREKGIFEVIDALNHLKPRFPALRLIVAGPGPDLKESQNLVKKLGLISEVEFLGHVSGESKRKIFAHSDLYLLPTKHGEGMPTALLEAMAYGLPVITCPVGGIRDFFEDGRHGFLSKTQNSLEIASLIEKLVSSADLFRNISRYNYQYARNRFFASQVAKRLKKIYSKLIYD